MATKKTELGKVNAEQAPSRSFERKLDWLDDNKDALWAISWAIFSLALILRSISLFDDHAPVWKSVGMLVWGMLGLAAGGVAALRREMSMAIAELAAEQRCNTSVVVYINIDEVLSHPAVVDVFDRLKKLRRVDHGMTHAEWTARISARYREREKKDKAVEIVKFRLNGGTLYINEELQRDSVMHYVLLIPDEAFKKDSRWALRDNEFFNYEGLRIRLVVANGLLKVQIGQWSRETAPSEEERLHDWIAWSTITTFSFALSPDYHRFPSRFLFFDYLAEPMFRDGSEKRRNALIRQARDYNRAISSLETYAGTRLWWRLHRQFQDHLKQEGYEMWDCDTPSTWQNRYMELSLYCQHDRHELMRWFLADTEVERQ